MNVVTSASVVLPLDLDHRIGVVKEHEFLEVQGSYLCYGFRVANKLIYNYYYYY